MVLFKRVALLVAVLLVALSALVFVLENQQPVSLRMLGWKSPSVPLALPVLLGLLAGLSISPLMIALLRAKGMIIRS